MKGGNVSETCRTRLLAIPGLAVEFLDRQRFTGIFPMQPACIAARVVKVCVDEDLRAAVFWFSVSRVRIGTCAGLFRYDPKAFVYKPAKRFIQSAQEPSADCA